MRKRVKLLVMLLLASGAMVLWCYRVAIADPVVRHARITLPFQGKPDARLRALLVSDIHVAGPDMPPERLERIVAAINKLAPDLVFIAGDFVSDRTFSTRSYSFADAVAPLARLRPRMGVFAVLGNHDHWRDAEDARSALSAVGVTILDNDAVRIGPFAIGGLDDAFTHHADIPGPYEG